MKKNLLTLVMAIFVTTAAFAQKSLNEVFPANFAKGVPTGWAFFQYATYEQVPGGLKVTCSQDAPKYRADLKYNVAETSDENFFTIDASNYKVFAIKFIGSRPTSGNLKLQNISVNGQWMQSGDSNAADYGLRTGNNQYTDDIEDTDGNHIYYWNLNGDKWTGELTINKIEIVIADIADESQKSYIISEINWYKDVDALKATIETDPVVINLTTEEKYDSFMDAYNAAVTDDVLSVVVPEIVIADRIPMKSITIEGATGNEKLVQNFNNKLLFNTGSNSNMSFKNLVFEAQQGPGNQPMFEHNANEKDGQTLTFDNVTLNGISSSNANGLFNIKKGVLALNNVTFSGCTVSEAKGFVTINDNNMLRLTGANEGVEVYLTAANSIEASDLSNTTPIKITLSDEVITTLTSESAEVKAVIIGEVSADKFKITNAGYSLESDGNGNLILVEDKGSNINEIEADNAPVEYYNLQGVKVANPEKGLYIMRKGDKVSKVIL